MKEQQQKISLTEFDHADILAAFPKVNTIKEEMSVLRKYVQGMISITELRDYLHTKDVSEDDINHIIRILAD